VSCHCQFLATSFTPTGSALLAKPTTVPCRALQYRRHRQSRLLRQFRCSFTVHVVRATVMCTATGRAMSPSIHQGKYRQPLPRPLQQSPISGSDFHSSSCPVAVASHPPRLRQQVKMMRASKRRRCCAVGCRRGELQASTECHCPSCCVALNTVHSIDTLVLSIVTQWRRPSSARAVFVCHRKHVEDQRLQTS
jgi:hypothetical protein